MKTKRLSKIIMLILCIALLCSGCGENGEQSSVVSETTQSTQSTADKQTETSRIQQNSRSAGKTSEEASQDSDTVSDSEPENSLQTSDEKSDESHPESSDTESSVTGSEPSQEMSDKPVKLPDESIVYEMDTKYFIKKLDGTLLTVFLQMYDAVQNFESSVTFHETIASESLDSLMFLLNYDCPELIQLNGDYSPLYDDDSCTTVSGVYFTYHMGEEDCRKYTDELHLFFENLKADIGEMSEIEKEKYVYDMIFDTCVYDDTDAYSGTVYGTLIRHVGRCEGISKSFAWCMRELGMECMCVSGTPKWDTTAVYAGHSWNIVKINGKYYQLDLTIDDLREADQDDEKHYPNYGFFNVDDAFNDRTHEVSGFYRELGLPECKSNNANYHMMNGLYIYANDELHEQVADIMEKHFIDGKIDHISLKFENKASLNQASLHMNDWIEEFVESQGITVYDYNSTCDEVCSTVVIYAEAFDENEEATEDMTED